MSQSVTTLDKRSESGSDVAFRAEVEHLRAHVEALEVSTDDAEELRHQVARALALSRRIRTHLPLDEGLLGGAAATSAWRLLIPTVAWVLLLSGAWALHEPLGSAALVSALAYFIAEAVA